MHTEASSEEPLLAQGSMSRASSGSSIPWRENEHNTRRVPDQRSQRPLLASVLILVGLDCSLFKRFEHAVEDAAGVMQMTVERRPEAVAEAHRLAARSGQGPRTPLVQMGLDHAKEDVQYGPAAQVKRSRK